MALCFAYYCSGHGYGHATRVSAFASSLLKLSNSISVHIVSSAPAHVFADSIKLGAHYRYAEIDPVVVQPVAYRVDRRKSVEVLRSFLEKKDEKVAKEVEWLREIHADAVLSDAAFLAFLAASKAHLPSILVTNFTFDSVYSYLSAVFVCQSPAATGHPDPTSFVHPALADDAAISDEELVPLVSQLQEGYLKADLLLRLPGAIPIPGFARDASLPACDWIDPSSMTFSIPIKHHIIQDPTSWDLHPSVPFAPSSNSQAIPKAIPRMARSAPLLVRLTSSDVYTPSGRSRILSSIGVPPHLHDPSKTKILVVSFGGQVIHKPKSRTSSRQPSISETPKDLHATTLSGTMPKGLALSLPGSGTGSPDLFSHALSKSLQGLAITQDSTTITKAIGNGVGIVKNAPSTPKLPKSLRIASATQIFIPGAPAPASISSPNPNAGTPRLPAVNTIPPTPNAAHSSSGSSDSVYSPSPPSRKFVASPPQDLVTSPLQNLVASPSQDLVGDGEGMQDSLLLPDDSWIAIVCGVSDAKGWGSSRTTPVTMSRTSSSEGTSQAAVGPENGSANHYLMPPPPLPVDEEDEEGLPAGFYIAPKDIYMPDLMAVGDVLLGKLGYGTVAECVESCTPFIYVSRPLFVEEHGLRLLLDREGVGIEMKREEYEAGDWASKVSEAWERGGERKQERRLGMHEVDRVGQTREMADFVVEWARRWGEGGKA